MAPPESVGGSNDPRHGVAAGASLERVPVGCEAFIHLPLVLDPEWIEDEGESPVGFLVTDL